MMRRRMMRVCRRLRLAVLAAATLLQCKSRPSAEVLALAAKTEHAVYQKPEYAYPLPYRVYVPAKYDASKKYPLILYLHGGGSRGTDNLKQLKEIGVLLSGAVQSIEPSFVLAPQCPEGDEWVKRDDKVPLPNYDQSQVPESDASKMTFRLLDDLQKKYSIDPQRIYLTGYSMGGSGTWDFITRHPGVFAAAVPVTGVNDPRRAGAIANLPIWAFHGDQDPVSPAENTRRMVEALRKLKSPIRYTELEGVGHDSARPAYGNSETFRWLLSQRRSPR